jgi:hypothetical protein
MVAFTFFMKKPTLAICRCRSPIRAKAFNYKLIKSTTLICMCDVNGVCVTSNTTFDTHLYAFNTCTRVTL